MASFGLQNTQCITRGHKQVTSGLPSTTGRLQLHAASPKQQVTPIFNTVLVRCNRIPCLTKLQGRHMAARRGCQHTSGELQLQASSFFGPSLPTRKQKLGVRRSAPLQVTAAAQTQVHLKKACLSRSDHNKLGKDLACILQVEVDKPLGLQLGAAKGPNGGLVVKVGCWLLHCSFT